MGSDADEYMYFPAPPRPPPSPPHVKLDEVMTEVILTQMESGRDWGQTIEGVFGANSTVVSSAVD